MNATLLQYCIICPMVFLAGFVDAVAGGGGLISLPTYMIVGIPTHFAIATNKMSSAMGTALATWRFARKGYVAWKLALLCAACGLLGSNAGARLALVLDDGVFKIVMLCLLPLVAFYVMRGKALDVEREAFSFSKTLGICLCISLAIGVYDGFYGPGTGTFLLLLLTSLAHLGLHEANGVTKVINLTTNVTALAVFFQSGKVILPLGLVAGCFSIAGNYLGAACFAKGGAKSVRPIILVVLSAFFVRILWELFLK